MIAPSFSTVSASTRTPDRTRRDGFTLVEILVVMLIIAIMASLITAVIGNALSSARAAATRATITKAHQLLKERRQAISRRNLRVEIKLIRQKFLGLHNTDLARIVSQKEILKVQIPQHLGDLFGPDRQAGTADDSPVLARLQQLNASFKPPGLSFPAGHQRETESAELLYVALTMGTELGTEGAAVDFTSSEAVDTDQDGLMELVDGWGQPLRFYRWPTRLIQPSQGNPVLRRDLASLLIANLPTVDEQLRRDQDDPAGRFGVWLSSGIGGNRATTTHLHTPGIYHVPLIVSAGQDGLLGLFEPYDTANLGHLAQPNPKVLLAADPNNTTFNDNITNHNIAIGGN